MHYRRILLLLFWKGLFFNSFYHFSLYHTYFLHYFYYFLVSDVRLYTLPCWSVCPSNGPSVPHIFELRVVFYITAPAQPSSTVELCIQPSCFLLCLDDFQSAGLFLLRHILWSLPVCSFIHCSNSLKIYSNPFDLNINIYIYIHKFIIK